MPISSLSTFQKAAQRTAFQQAAEAALKPLFGAADANGLLALMLRDAATYDAETKTGGYDGSILINRCVRACALALKDAYLKLLPEAPGAACGGCQGCAVAVADCCNVLRTAAGLWSFAVNSCSAQRVKDARAAVEACCCCLAAFHCIFCAVAVRS
jgi:hypothetical protein